MDDHGGPSCRRRASRTTKGRSELAGARKANCPLLRNIAIKVRLSYTRGISFGAIVLLRASPTSRPHLTCRDKPSHRYYLIMAEQIRAIFTAATPKPARQGGCYFTLICARLRGFLGGVVAAKFTLQNAPQQTFQAIFLHILQTSSPRRSFVSGRSKRLTALSCGCRKSSGWRPAKSSTPP